MNLTNVLNLKCVICGKKYDVDQIEYVCPDHGYDGVLDVQYDYKDIKKRISKEQLKKSGDYSIWRYKDLLPVHPDAVAPNLTVGWTPLYNVPHLAKTCGIKELYIKDEGRQPTASFKDRASAIGIVKAAEKGFNIITTASTGNAAAALSGLCASFHMDNVIFVPETAPKAKITQLLVFGSKVVLVKGSYDDAFELCLNASEKYGWYNRNTGYNPYMTEGKKTAAFEICEQLEWKAPDRIYVSVGDGSIIGGLHKGLKDLNSLGWIDKMPKLIGVQAEGSNYLYTAWKENEDVLSKPKINADTIADSICSGLPRDRIKALAAVKETDGEYVCVNDNEILGAIPELSMETGIFAEPAGAAAYAGFLKSIREKSISSDETVVVINTGNGLKDINSAIESADLAGIRSFKIDPDMESFDRLVRKWE